jgi:hypothetical protein
MLYKKNIEMMLNFIKIFNHTKENFQIILLLKLSGWVDEMEKLI